MAEGQRQARRGVHGKGAVQSRKGGQAKRPGDKGGRWGEGALPGAGDSQGLVEAWALGAPKWGGSLLMRGGSLAGQGR